MSMMSEFKEFAMKGNVIDMAIGIVMGVAFGKIVASFVGDILMPVIGKLTGGVDFSQKYINLTSESYPTLKAAEEAGASIMRHGNFIQTIIDFVIIALVIFMVVKVMNNAKKKEEAAPPPAPPKEEVLLTEIRDLLKK